MTPKELKMLGLDWFQQLQFDSFLRQYDATIADIELVKVEPGVISFELKLKPIEYIILEMTV